MDIVKSLMKFLVVCVVYLGIGPLLGHFMVGKDKFRRIMLGFMAWWLVRPPSDFTLMLYSIPKYRGHCRGFEFNYLEAIALGFALCAIWEKRRDFRFMPPGLWAWFLWIFLCMLSIPTAIEPIYGLMPAFKFAKMGFIYVGIFAAIHDDRDLKAMMRGFSIALILQLWICLWARYVQGGYRIHGWFEHQNPMAMWSYTLAFPILGLALSKETKPKDVALFFGAFGAAGLVILLTVARAALASFVVGSFLMMMGSYLHGFTARRVVLGVLGGVAGAAAIAMAADTFMARSTGDSSPKNDLRYALNLQSKAMLSDHPLAGIGWNNYGLANSRPHGTKYSAVLERWEANRGQMIYPENFRVNPLTESLYWLLLAENGSLGFASFLLFAILTLWFSMRGTLAFWRTPVALFCLGIFVSLLVMYFHLQVERIIVQTKNLTTWIMLCAVAAKLEWWRRDLAAKKKLEG